jgi:hypothetical protein
MARERRLYSAQTKSPAIVPGFRFIAWAMAAENCSSVRRVSS